MPAPCSWHRGANLSCRAARRCFSGLILIAATYAWSKVAFNWRVAILTAAGLAVSFWAVMTARHALRSVTMPALFTLAAWFFWRALRKRQRDETAWREFALAGLLLGATMYTYMPARIMWVIFPALLVFGRCSSAQRDSAAHVAGDSGVACLDGYGGRAAALFPDDN